MAAINMEHKRDDEKTKQEEFDEMLLHGTFTGILSMLDRTKQIEDPLLRNMLMLDKILTFYDMGSGMMSAMIESKIKNPETRMLAKQVIKGTHAALKDLSDWVQHPQYSPERLFGNTLMKNCGKDLQEKADHKKQ